MVFAEDNFLVREGTSALLAEVDEIDLVGAVEDPNSLMKAVAELHPDANRHAEQIWCAADAATSWASWVLQQRAPAEANCASTPIAELAALGAKLKITGTPTMFTVDGNRVVGAIDKDELERRLTEASAATRVAAVE